jgi:hypothetical protein
MISDFKYFLARDKIVKSVIHPSSNRSLTHTQKQQSKKHTIKYYRLGILLKKNKNIPRADIPTR